jgi:integrase
MKTKIRPSSGIITVVIKTAQGKRTISTGCTDPAEARQLIKAANVSSIEALAKVNALSQAMIQKLVVGANLTVEGAVAQWEQWLRSVSASDRTADNHAMFVKAWMRDTKLANKKMTSIAEQEISKWINRNDGTKFASKRVKLAALRSLFNFCSIRQYLNGDPSREVRVKAKLLTHDQKEPRRKTCFTEDEIKRIVAYLSDRMLELDLNPDHTPAQDHRLEVARFWYCATIIGRYAGLRLGDICCLERASLAKEGKLIVHTDKRDTRVELDVDESLAKGIAAIPESSKKLCFPEQDAIMRGPQRSKLSVQFSRVLEACKITGHSFHDLRRSYACDCKAKGIPTPHIAKRLGHGSEESTETYLH